MKFFCIILCLFVAIHNGYCQADSVTYKVPFKVQNGDTIYMASLGEVNIILQRSFKNKWDERKYWKLVYNLKKVYPFAKLAKDKLNEMNDHFLTLNSERERKAYAKQVENDLRDKFEEDLKKLTVTQGRLLIKLIDRETGKTSYELVKELRGSLSAIFWQTLARLFGSNLKTEYDAAGTDKLIEEILVAIDEGYL